MTLIVCIEGEDGLVMASDSRGTFGDPRGVTAQNDSIKKLYKVSDYVGIVMAGAGELAVSLMDELQKVIKDERLQGVTPIFNKFRELAKKRYGEWFSSFAIQPNPNGQSPTRPSVSVIVGGYDVDEGENPTFKKIYRLSSQLDFAPQRSDYGFAVDGIAQYALYLFNRFYVRRKDVGDLTQLAVYSITETASQDGKVGGDIQAIKITKQKAKELTKLEVDRIIKINENRSSILKNSFFAAKKKNAKKKDNKRKS